VRIRRLVEPGFVSGVSGSLPSTQLPAVVSNATYSANNQLPQWGSTAMTYDLNGNKLSDGMNSYIWDARNRLSSANNNAARFAYDPLGRRVSKTILSTTTNYLYDGDNAIQESGTNPTANLLTGGLDERFLRTSSTETDDYLTDALGSTVVSVLCSHPRHAYAGLQRWRHGSEQGTYAAICRGEATDCGVEVSTGAERGKSCAGRRRELTSGVPVAESLSCR